MKLNKTEAHILEYVNERGRYGAVALGGHGPEGGKKNAGWREYNACKSLIEKRLVRLVDRGSHVEYRHGWGLHVYEIVVGKLQTGESE